MLRMKLRRGFGHRFCAGVLQRLQRIIYGLRIRGRAAIVDNLRQIVLAGQTQRQRAEGRIKPFVERHDARGLKVGGIGRGALPDHGQQGIPGKGAASLPLVEGIRVMRQKKRTFSIIGAALKDHGRGEFAQDRRNGTRGEAGEFETLLRFGHLQHAGLLHLVAVLAQKANLDRNDARRLFCLPRRGRCVLGKGQRIGTIGVAVRHRQARCARLLVPAFELGQIAARHILEHPQPVLDRAGLSVMPPEIERERLGPRIIPDQRLQHSDQFGALLIDGGGIEIVDLHKTVGPHRVGQRAVILAELAGAQGDHILNPFNRGAAHVSGELCVAKDRQPFLEAKLKPVAAGDPVAGPVVKILMRNDCLDPLEIGIRRCFRAGQYAGGIEDVQPLVLHGAHVEIVNRDNVEQIQIVFSAIHLLVPAHRILQRLHAEGAFILIPGAHPYIQGHLAARHGGKAARVVDQISRNQREKIAGLRPGIVPFGKAVPGRNRIAVRQQHRLIGFDTYCEDAHHIRAVRVVGDLAEPLCLALRAIHPAGHVEPLQRGICGRVYLDLSLPQEFGVRHDAGEAGFRDVGCNLSPIDAGRNQRHAFAVQSKFMAGRVGVWMKGDAAQDACPRRVQPERQMHVAHKPVGSGIVRQIDYFGGSIFHPVSFSVGTSSRGRS